MGDRQRQQLAELTARLIAESGYTDWKQAKTKASKQLGLSIGTDRPRNAEIEAALANYQRVFQANGLDQHVSNLRAAAEESLQFFKPFHPRLIGNLVETTATLHSGIELHLFSDWSDEIAVFLCDNDIPVEQQDKRYRTTAGKEEWLPSFGFIAGGINVELSVFPLSRIHQPPLSPITGHTMRRLSLAEYQRFSSRQR